MPEITHNNPHPLYGEGEGVWFRLPSVYSNILQYRTGVKFKKGELIRKEKKFLPILNRLHRGAILYIANAMNEKGVSFTRAYKEWRDE